MKVLYFLSLIIGILIYLYLHNINNFSIGIPKIKKYFNVRLYRNDQRNSPLYYLVNIDGEEGGAVSGDQVLLWEGLLPVNEFNDINTFFNDTNFENDPRDYFAFTTREPSSNVPIEEPSPYEIFKAQLISIGLSEDDAEILRRQFISIYSPGHIGLASISGRERLRPWRFRNDILVRARPLPSLPADVCAVIVNMTTLFDPQHFINFLRDLLILQDMSMDLFDSNYIIDDYLLLLPFLEDSNYDRDNVLNAYVAYLKNRRRGQQLNEPRRARGQEVIAQPSLQKFIWLYLNGKLVIDHNIFLHIYWTEDEINRLYEVQDS